MSDRGVLINPRPEPDSEPMLCGGECDLTFCEGSHIDGRWLGLLTGLLVGALAVAAIWEVMG